MAQVVAQCVVGAGDLESGPHAMARIDILDQAPRRVTEDPIGATPNAATGDLDRIPDEEEPYAQWTYAFYLEQVPIELHAAGDVEPD